MNDCIKTLTEKIKNINDKPYYILNACFCMFLVLCGLSTTHTYDYSIHTQSMASISFYPPAFLDLLKNAGYPLWHITDNYIMKLLSCTPAHAAGLSSGFWLVVSFCGVLYFMQKWFGDTVNKYLVCSLCFILFIVGPIWIPWKNHLIIIGCGGPNVWHNATNICGRAVGVFAFFCFMKVLEKMVNSDYSYIPSLKQCIGLSFLFVFSLFAKPSFMQSFAPSFGILLIYHLIKSRGKSIKEFGVFCAVSILPFLYLMRQFLFYFSTSDQTPGIVTQQQSSGIQIYFEDFGAILHSIDCQFLILMFPIIMSVIVAVKGKFDMYNAVVWLMDLISFMAVILLHGAAQGEMGWACYIAYFFNYMVGLRDFIRLYFTDCKWDNQKIKKATFVAACLVLAINLLVGVYYLYKMAIVKVSIF